MIRYLIGTAAVLLGSASFQTHAQDSICPSLLSWGLYDRSQILETKYKFSLVRTVMCGASNTTYATAQKAQAELRIPILDALTATFGGATDSSNFEQRKQEFCADHLNQQTASESQIQNVERISTALTNAFVQCVSLEAGKRPGLYAYVQTLPVYEAFTIEIFYQHDTSAPTPFIIEKISSAPEVVGCDITTPSSPISTSTYTINCQKPADKTVVVSMVTNKGSMKGTVVPKMPGFEEQISTDIQRLESRLNSVNAHVTSIEQQISQVSQRTDNITNIKLDKSELSALQGRLGDWGNGDADASAIFRGNGGTAKAMCPRGYYAVGVTVHDEDGGKYATSSINGVTLHCKPLNR